MLGMLNNLYKDDAKNIKYSTNLDFKKKKNQVIRAHRQKEKKKFNSLSSCIRQ